VLRKGDIEHNTNEYRLLLWKTANLSASVAPEVLLRMSSSSNRPAIHDVTWLSDNNTLVFLGEHPNELQQLYRLNTTTRRLKRLTTARANVLFYSSTPNASQFAYITEEPVTSMFDSTARRQGVVIGTQSLADLVKGKQGGHNGKLQLLFHADEHHTRQLSPTGRIGLGTTLSVSPNGKYVVVSTRVADIPETWRGYTDPALRHWMERGRVRPGQYSNREQYQLIDTSTNDTQSLMNAPVGLYGSELAWAADSRSLVVSGTYLPLDGVDPAERKAREGKTFSVEVKIPSKDIEVISDRDMRFLQWDKKEDLLVFEAGRRSLSAKPESQIFFRNSTHGWQEVHDSRQERNTVEISLEEDMATPPRIVALDEVTHGQSMLLELNPQFKALTFGRVEEVKWTRTNGEEGHGGLYYPADYVAGVKYPLVIQTHGWEPERFWVDGPWTTAFAAQPLAGKGIMVLQAYDSSSYMDSTVEVARENANYEGAIKYLDERGLIDAGRVGIIGFSRTCLHVEYSLVHARYRFSAASITDGVDGSYWQYLVYSNSIARWNEIYDGINGAAPFSGGLKSWLERAPSFSFDKLHTPLRITALNPESVLFEWGSFAPLFRLDRPVEMVTMEDGDHILQRPWDRIVSQQGNVDWFCFWLKGEEDPDPAKVEQYKRWRELRKLQEENERSR